MDVHNACLAKLEGCTRYCYARGDSDFYLSSGASDWLAKGH